MISYLSMMLNRRTIFPLAINCGEQYLISMILCKWTTSLSTIQISVFPIPLSRSSMLIQLNVCYMTLIEIRHRIIKKVSYYPALIPLKLRQSTSFHSCHRCLLFYYCLLLRELFSYSVVRWGIVPEPTAKALYLTKQHYRKTVLEGEDNNI